MGGKRAASGVAAWSLVVLIIVLTAADMPLGYATRWAGDIHLVPGGDLSAVDSPGG